jgi:hypothetical protein
MKDLEFSDSILRLPQGSFPVEIGKYSAGILFKRCLYDKLIKILTKRTNDDVLFEGFVFIGPPGIGKV